MNDFDNYVNQIMGESESSFDKEASSPEVSQVQQGFNTKVASAIEDASANLPQDLKEYADSLAWMEAFTTQKQANLIKDQVQEAITLNMNNSAYNQQYNSPNDGVEANALYNQTFLDQSQFLKTASEAQAFVDGIYAKNFRNRLADEAATWNVYAHQNINY